jgi:hypothetical protein
VDRPAELIEIARAGSAETPDGRARQERRIAVYPGPDFWDELRPELARTGVTSVEDRG